MVLVAGTLSGLVSCTDDNMMHQQPEEADALSLNTQPYVNDFKSSINHSATYVSSNAFGGDAEMLKKFRLNFPTVSGINGAGVAVFDAGDVYEGNTALDNAYKSGSVIAITSPTAETVRTLKKMGHETGFSTYDPTSRKLVAYDNRGHNYVMLEGGTTTETPIIEETLSATEAKKVEEAFNQTADTRSGEEDQEIDNSYFEGLAYWVNNISKGATRTDTNTSDIDKSCKYVDLDFVTKMDRQKLRNLGACYSTDYSETHTSHIYVNYRIYPLHGFAAQNGSKNGDVEADYYIVEGGARAENSEMYRKYHNGHGSGSLPVNAHCDFMTNLHLEYELVDANGDPLHTTFYRNPFPATTQSSIDIKKSESVGFGFSLGMMFTCAGPAATGSLNFSYSHTNETIQTMRDIEILQNCNKGKVSYDYIVRNWDNEGGTHTPVVPDVSTHSMLVQNEWVWKVPAKTNPGAADYSTDDMFIRINIAATYGTVVWQNGCVNKKRWQRTWSSSETMNETGTPQRVPYGLLAIKNASSHHSSRPYQIGNVTIWKADKNGDKVKAPVIEDKQTSVCKETMNYILDEGSYYVEYDKYQDNKLLGKYCHKNVKIKMGLTAPECTTNLDVLEAQKIK